MRVLLFVLTLFVVFALPVSAQDGTPPRTYQPSDPSLPPPQFLYRDGDQLVFINGFTGETTPINNLMVAERDKFEWSPDGQYLIGRVTLEESENCLNIFDVDAEMWVYEEPIECDVGETLFNADQTVLFYTVNDETSGAVWEFSLTTEMKERIFVDESERLNSIIVTDLMWSPNGTFLSLVTRHFIMGGSNNALQIVNMGTRVSYEIAAPNAYYANYYPIWSPDGEWFLIVLNEEYVYSGSLPTTNHRGDLYLVNAVSGESTRLTYTPAEGEGDVGWTEDGNIVFTTTTLIENRTELPVAEALEITPVASDQIVYPDPVDVPDYDDCYLRPRNANPSVFDSNALDTSAWIDYENPSNGESFVELNIGTFACGPRPRFTFVIDHARDAFGWRPSNIVYGQG